MPKAINGRFCDESTYHITSDEADPVPHGGPIGHFDLAVQDVGPLTEVGVAKTHDGEPDLLRKLL
jgi:hypothetical protein